MPPIERFANLAKKPTDLPRILTRSHILAEELAMKARVLILILALTCHNQVLAEPEKKIETRVEASRNAKSGEYSEFNFGVFLVDKPSDFRRNKAILGIDKNGKPAVYPLFDERYYCIMLDRHSLNDVLAHWGPAKVEDGVYSYYFSYWDGHWTPARVDLQFGENYCSQFRVVADCIKMQSWLPAGGIPKKPDDPAPSTDGKLKLPPFLGMVEGPRDMSDCSIRPTADPALLKGLNDGKCPLGI